MALAKFSCALFGVALFSGSACADFEDDYEVKKWEEVAVQLPSPPKESSLQPFFVSATTDNKFWVDADSVSIGADGVVRYTLVVMTASGARNVSYEGMRCETKERRLYASGRRDGSWSKSRANRWVRIQEAVANRQYAALFTEYFCPGGVLVLNAAEAREALRRGGQPSSLSP